MKALVLGARGYTGRILVQLLCGHPEVKSVTAVSSSEAGEVPTIGGTTQSMAHHKIAGGVYQSPDAVAQWDGDVVFAALPHLKSAAVWKPLVGKSVIIDLSADMRISDPALFERYYRAPLPLPIDRDRVAYGLSELNHTSIKQCDIIANPGCFPTAILLPLLPLVYEHIIGASVIVNAITGISGAGLSSNPNFLFSERTENCGAYNPGTVHRHTAELTEQLPTNAVSFTPHLAPLSRGLVATTAVQLGSGADEKDIHYCYNHYFKGKPFMHYTRDAVPQSRAVRGSNRCDYSWQLCESGGVTVADEGASANSGTHTSGTRTLLLFSAIDNLMKGASGQAVQNMNIRFGFDEQCGVPLHSVE